MSEILFFTAGVIVAALFAIAAGLGVIIARMNTQITKEPPKQAYKPTEEEIRKAQRIQKEVINMLSYNGDPQEEIHID